MEDYYQDIYKEKDEKVVLSPSGRYRLLIRYYGTRPGCWNYSRGTVYRVRDNAEICDIKRNYSTFHYSFVTKKQEEWLITGRSYMSQTLVNLETKQEFEPPGNQSDGAAFCWSSAFLSPDENILVVVGCHWACPYEYRFFDFTDPSKGWAELETDVCIYDDLKKPIFGPDPSQVDLEENPKPDFSSKDVIHCYQTEQYNIVLQKYFNDLQSDEWEKVNEDDPTQWKNVEKSRITLRRDGNKLITLAEWVSKREQQNRETNEKARLAEEAWKKEFWTTDPLYLIFKKLTLQYASLSSDYETYGITHSTWCPDFQEQETRWCKRIVQKSKSAADEKGTYTVDLEWAVKTGPIKLVIYRDGKHLEDKFYPHSTEAMEEAYQYAVSLTQPEEKHE